MRPFSFAAIIFFGLIFLFGSESAHAQFATVVSSCPTTRANPYTIGTLAYPTVDVNGTFCTNAAGGGGGGSVTQGTVPWIINTTGSSILDDEINAGTATTGTAVPSSAIYLGVNVGGYLVGMVPGTAGTPSTQVWTVQGNASGTPVPVTVSSATGLAQASTTAGQTGSLVMCAVTTSPVTFTNLQTDPFTCTLGGAVRHDVTSWAGTALGAPSNFGTSPGAVVVPGVNAFAFGTTSNASSGVATGATNIPDVSYNYGYNGTTWDQLQVDASKNLKVTIQSNATVTTDPCASGTHQFIPISQTTSTQLAAAGSAGTVNYICGYKWVGADAENISLVEGTGSVCATDTTAIDGGTTAAAGPNYAANSGAAGGTGRATLTAGTKTAHAVCLFQSGSGRVAGFLNLVQQ